MNRKDVTAGLLKAATGYFVKRGFSVHKEVGITKRGRKRVDLLAFNYKGNVVVAEIKSGNADLTTDKKWHTYLELGCCNKFYFVITEKLFSSYAWKTVADKARTYGAGVMVLSKTSGLLEVKIKARSQEMKEETFNKMMLKLAWRGGSHKGNTRRTRVYL